MTPEPLLTPPATPASPRRPGTRGEIGTYRVSSAHLSSWRTQGTRPPKRVPPDHPMTLSGAGRTVGYQRRQRDERGLRFVQIDLEAIERRLFADPTICSLIARDYGVEPEPESPKELAYVVIGGD
jgi:hypothetical protein